MIQNIFISADTIDGPCGRSFALPTTASVLLLSASPERGAEHASEVEVEGYQRLLVELDRPSSAAPPTTLQSTHDLSFGPFGQDIFPRYVLLLDEKEHPLAAAPLKHGAHLPMGETLRLRVGDLRVCAPRTGGRHRATFFSPECKWWGEIGSSAA